MRLTNWLCIVHRVSEGGAMRGKKAGLFDCRFDASGKPTIYCRAKGKEESGELGIAVKK
jgi:hypothetical protein